MVIKKKYKMDFINCVIKNKEGYYEGVLTACDPARSGDPKISARVHVNIAENWLKNNKFVPWGHNKKSKEENGYLFVHQKGKKDVIALLEYVNIIDKKIEKKSNFNETMFPYEWKKKGDYEGDYYVYCYFYKVIRVIWPKIPFDILENRNGKPLSPRGGMNELVPVQVKKVFK